MSVDPEYLEAIHKHFDKGQDIMAGNFSKLIGIDIVLDPTMGDDTWKVVCGKKFYNRIITQTTRIKL